MEQKQEKKMFLEIVEQLRKIIVEQNILPGEKLPSERVLSEMLNVGRSSVREALRSLELLGLIESKHGGGTYLGTAQKHRLVEVVGSFILQDDQSIHDVLQTRYMHEKEAIRTIAQSKHLRESPIWESFFDKIELNEEVSNESILKELIIISGNRLALKIWLQLAAYSKVTLYKTIDDETKEVVQTFLKALQLGYEQQALQAYKQWMDTISRH